MLKSISLFSILFLFSAFAYEPTITCNDGAMVIDKYRSNGEDAYQMVIRDSNITRYFASAGIVGTKESQYSNEMIFDGMKSTSLKAFVPFVKTARVSVYTYITGDGGLTVVAKNLEENISVNWTFQYCH